MSIPVTTAAIYLLPLVLILSIYLRRHIRVERKNLATLQDTVQSGLNEPASLHPVIDPSKCIGCGSCVRACPEHTVLGLIHNHAQLISASSCIGHGACQKACPMNAIDLVFGTATRGVDIPLLSDDFQTTVPGIYIAGELGGMGLIRNAIEQGRQAMEAITRQKPDNKDTEVLDVLIIGAGPAGISASLAAKAAKMRHLTLDQETTLGGTVAHFPRGKVVMTQAAHLPLVGQVKISETSKEQLLQFWHKVLKQHPIPIRFGEQVLSIEQHDDHFLVKTNNHAYTSRQILLTIGRRGTPRKLDIPGEERNKVVYRLIDPDQYHGQSVLVVGGGDSALEAAASLAETGMVKTTIAYRGNAFNRAKGKNRQRVEQLQQQGRLQLLLNSSPVRINAASVQLDTPDGPINLDNDSVIVCAGGVLPSGFLQQIGIAMETKYGTA